ncbi:hypothetical protein RIF29_14323 [Crotalaria pallida]|uniref:Uncharacterized protein n=1 Tax=Crotalaria pallida TaxID=3830 RepID=A0AAN9FD50_CROPI
MLPFSIDHSLSCLFLAKTLPAPRLTASLSLSLSTIPGLSQHRRSLSSSATLSVTHSFSSSSPLSHHRRSQALLPLSSSPTATAAPKPSITTVGPLFTATATATKPSFHSLPHPQPPPLPSPPSPRLVPYSPPPPPLPSPPSTLFLTHSHRRSQALHRYQALLPLSSSPTATAAPKPSITTVGPLFTATATATKPSFHSLPHPQPPPLPSPPSPRLVPYSPPPPPLPHHSRSHQQPPPHPLLQLLQVTVAASLQVTVLLKECQDIQL